MKIIMLSLVLLCCGCQIQINLASNVTNVPVIKAQLDTEDTNMTGSSLEDVKKGGDKADMTVPIP